MNTLIFWLLAAASALSPVAGTSSPNFELEEIASLQTAADTKNNLTDEVLGRTYDTELSLTPETPETESENGVRFRRVTCDLLSFSTKYGSLNHAACAAHCIAKRKKYRGGYCSKGVCHCRK